MKEVDGERVRLDSEDDTGWIESNKIILLDQAINFYTKELLANSNNAEAYFERGMIWALLDKEDEAIADFTEAIRLDPKNGIRFTLWRAMIFRDEKNYDKAIADYTEAIRLDPSDLVAFLYRGRVWDDTGEYDKAIEDFTQAIRLDPKSALGFNSRGHAWAAKENTTRRSPISQRPFDWILLTRTPTSPEERSGRSGAMLPTNERTMTRPSPTTPRQSGSTQFTPTPTSTGASPSTG